MVSERSVTIALSDVYHVLHTNNHLKAGIDMDYT